MLIFLLGYMGSGKSFTGMKLAEMLYYRFLDLDEMIEISSGYSIKDYFEKFGEASFRKKERELLLSHLDDKDTVIASGGGTPCFEDNMDLMNQNGITVFLDTRYEIILDRLREKIPHRPLLSKLPPEQIPEFIKKHLEERRIFYENAKLKVEGNDIDWIVREISKLKSDWTLSGPSDADRS
jgi:shikimate kinase